MNEQSAKHKSKPQLFVMVENFMKDNERKLAANEYRYANLLKDAA